MVSFSNINNVKALLYLLDYYTLVKSKEEEYKSNHGITYDGKREKDKEEVSARRERAIEELPQKYRKIIGEESPIYEGANPFYMHQLTQDAANAVFSDLSKEDKKQLADALSIYKNPDELKPTDIILGALSALEGDADLGAALCKVDETECKTFIFYPTDSVAQLFLSGHESVSSAALYDKVPAGVGINLYFNPELVGKDGAIGSNNLQLTFHPHISAGNNLFGQGRDAVNGRVFVGIGATLQLTSTQYFMPYVSSYYHWDHKYFHSPTELFPDKDDNQFELKTGFSVAIGARKDRQFTLKPHFDYKKVWFSRNFGTNIAVCPSDVGADMYIDGHQISSAECPEKTYSFGGQEVLYRYGLEAELRLHPVNLKFNFEKTADGETERPLFAITKVPGAPGMDSVDYAPWEIGGSFGIDPFYVFGRYSVRDLSPGIREENFYRELELRPSDKVDFSLAYDEWNADSEYQSINGIIFGVGFFNRGCFFNVYRYSEKGQGDNIYGFFAGIDVETLFRGLNNKEDHIRHGKYGMKKGDSFAAASKLPAAMYQDLNVEPPKKSDGSKDENIPESKESNKVKIEAPIAEEVPEVIPAKPMHQVFAGFVSGNNPYTLQFYGINLKGKAVKAVILDRHGKENMSVPVNDGQIVAIAKEPGEKTIVGQGTVIEGAYEYIEKVEITIPDDWPSDKYVVVLKDSNNLLAQGGRPIIIDYVKKEPDKPEPALGVMLQPKPDKAALEVDGESKDEGRQKSDDSEVDPSKWQISVMGGIRNKEIEIPEIENRLPWDFSTKLTLSPQLAGAEGAVKSRAAELTFQPHGEFSFNYPGRAQKYSFGADLNLIVHQGKGKKLKDPSGVFFFRLLAGGFVEKQQYEGDSIFSPAVDDYGVKIGLGLGFKYKKYFFIEGFLNAMGGYFDHKFGQVNDSGQKEVYSYSEIDAVGGEAGINLNLALADFFYLDSNLKLEGKYLCTDCEVEKGRIVAYKPEPDSSNADEHNSQSANTTTFFASARLKKYFGLFYGHYSRQILDTFSETGNSFGVQGGLGASQLSFTYDNYEANSGYSGLKGYTLSWISETGFFRINGYLYTEDKLFDDYYGLNFSLDFAKPLFAPPNIFGVGRYGDY